MPARPEFLYAFCGIRAVKVLHESDAHNARASDRYIGVSRKVAVDLERKKHCRKQNGRTVRSRRIRVYRNDISRAEVGDSYLLEKSDEHHANALAGIVAVETVILAELRNKIFGSFDGTCNELREERNVQRVISEMTFGCYISPVHVYDI